MVSHGATSLAEFSLAYVREEVPRWLSSAWIRQTPCLLGYELTAPELGSALFTWDSDLGRKDAADTLKLGRKFELGSHFVDVSAFCHVEAFFLSAFCDLEYVSEASGWETSRNLDVISFYLHILIRYENLGLDSLPDGCLGLRCLHHRVTREVGSNLVCCI